MKPITYFYVLIVQINNKLDGVNYMSIFFEKMNKKKSSAPFIILKLLLIVLMIAMLVMAILNDIEIFYVKLVFVLVGINSIVEGIESYLQKESKKTIRKEMGLGVLFFLIAIILL